VTSKRWQEIDKLLEGALELDAGERAAFLDQACAGDETLRRKVDALLISHEREARSVETPALEMTAQPLSNQARSMVGCQLSHYQILEFLGAGGMGEVYRARDIKLDRTVALKLLPAEFASAEGPLQRFVQEAKAASALNHPNILTIHEIDETESGYFLATEFIEGQTLRERLRSSSIKLSDAIDIAIQIAGALSAAHAARIVHRDVKPENVMIRQDGIVKVLDFGIAKLTEGTIGSIDTEAPTRVNLKTDPSVVLGTATYMSPEQARGLSLDARTDIFSLGVVLYEMIAGRLPFDGSNCNEIIAAILSDKEPQPLTRYSSEIPSELVRLVSKALRKNRDERYQTIKDMLLDLSSLQRQLEFERKLESSASSVRSKTNEQNASAIAGAETTDRLGVMQAPTTQTSTAKFIVSGIKRHNSAIALLILLAVGLGAWLLFRRQPETSTIDSIAVLPFENVTHDQSLEYLSDGVTESLINSLSQLPNIKVIARNSVFSYKGQTPAVADVARQLNVRAVLTGRVQMHGDTLDVRAELTDAQTNAQLWGDHYTRKVSDIFAVQDEIARQVTDTLRVRLSSGQQEQISKRSTQNTQAYQLYLQGRYYLNEAAAEQCLKRAV
jgi:serine/threonine-protein kinase